jgi:hypothetical protein
VAWFSAFIKVSIIKAFGLFLGHHPQFAMFIAATLSTNPRFENCSTSGEASDMAAIG